MAETSFHRHFDWLFTIFCVIKETFLFWIRKSYVEWRKKLPIWKLFNCTVNFSNFLLRLRMNALELFWWCYLPKTINFRQNVPFNEKWMISRLKIWARADEDEWSRRNFPFYSPDPNYPIKTVLGIFLEYAYFSEFNLGLHRKEKSRSFEFFDPRIR